MAGLSTPGGTMEHRTSFDVRRALATAAIGLALAACAEPTQPALPGTAASRAEAATDDAFIPATYTVLPFATSETNEVSWVPPTVPNPNPAFHYAWLPQTRIKHPMLFVFMPGT